MKEIIKTSQDYFSYLRTVFVEEILSNVLNEGNVESEPSKIKRKLNRICSNEACQKIYETLKFKCDDCKSKVVKNSFNQVQKTDFPEPLNFEFDFENQNNQNNKYISMTEPIFVNPNSYDNITVIMDKLKEAVSIGNERQWSFIGSDGPPYVISNRLIDSDPVKYLWVAMSNGLGHLYMNQIKTFFSVYKSIFLEELARDVLHFQTPNALNHFFRCSNTHKSYQALEVLLYGTTYEMLHSYVKQCDSEPSVEDVAYDQAISFKLYACHIYFEKRRS